MAKTILKIAKKLPRLSDISYWKNIVWGTNVNEFEEAYERFKRNKAEGFHDLNSNIIIDAYDSLKNILFHVFKISIQQGIFPGCLKIAKVTPIFISGDKDNVRNYRSISILSVFSKVLERIMYNRVYDHLDSSISSPSIWKTS